MKCQRVNEVPCESSIDAYPISLYHTLADLSIVFVEKILHKNKQKSESVFVQNVKFTFCEKCTKNKKQNCAFLPEQMFEPLSEKVHKKSLKMT